MDLVLVEKDIERYWSKVQRLGPDECWPWIGKAFPSGYGVFSVKIAPGLRRSVIAHRVALRLTTGTWGKVAMHACDNPPCCNPAHLAWGTQRDNVADARGKGRWNPGQYGRPEHLPRGERHYLAKLSSAQVAEIKSLYSTGAHTLRDLATRYQAGKSTIHYIVKGVNRKAG